MPLESLLVVAGALLNPIGQVLVSQRPLSSHQGGRWEFPGGKREPGESPEQTLIREFQEEIGVQITACRPLIRIRHAYPERAIDLSLLLITGYHGTPRPMEGQPLRWLHPEALDPTVFPAADRPMITALRLPECYSITPPDQSPNASLTAVEQALASGRRLIQLRAHHLSDAAYLALAECAVARCLAAGARLLCNRHPDSLRPLLQRWPQLGIHLSGHHLRQLKARPPAALVAASCHGPEDLALVSRLGLDFAVLSPIAATPSHPKAAPLGWETFHHWVTPCTFPVYALGGMTPQDLPSAWQAGGQGIAGIRGLLHSGG